MQKHRPLLLILGLAIGAGLASLLVPVPDGMTPMVFYSSFVSAVVNITLFAGSIVLFLLALKNFKRAPRIAYLVLCAGLACAGIGALQYPFISLFNLWATPYVAQGWSETPFLIGLCLFYVSALIFSKLVGVKHILTKWPLVFGGILALSLLSFLIPHSTDPAIEHSLDLLVAYNTWEILFVVAGLGLLLATKKRTSVLYATPLAWLSIFYGLTIFGGLQLVVAFLLGGSESWFVVGNYSAITYILGGLASVKAAEAFNRNSSTDKLPILTLNPTEVGFFGKVLSDKSRQLSCVDVATSLANLVSDRQAVDPLLDKLRFITARLEPGQPISDEDQQKIAAICKEIIEYLVTQERVRKFNQQDLHTLVRENFSERVSEPVFWQSLESK